MSKMLEFLTELVRKFENLVLYFIERFSANFQVLGQTAQTVVVVIGILGFLALWYIIIVILRLFFKHSLRHLKNVQYEYKIVLERQQGKRCSLIHEILYFQKVVVLDEYIIRETAFVEEVSEKKKLKLKLPRKKNREKIHSAPLLDPADDIYVVDFIKLNRRMLISSFFIVVTILTLFLSKYHDFDIIFRAIYMLKYVDYIFLDNLGSWLFIFGFGVSILMTIFIWVFFYTRGSWQDKLNMQWVYDSFDIVAIVPTFIAILTILNAFLISPATVTHTSMEPNYFEGDNIFILHMTKYDRFDVVVVLAEEGEYLEESDAFTMNEYYIKRIIGLPGETVRIANGVVSVDGVVIDDSEYLKLNTMTYCDVGANVDVEDTCTFVVPEGEYFLLGDNRTASFDSRDVGTFKEKYLYGAVIFKVG